MNLANSVERQPLPSVDSAVSSRFNFWVPIADGALLYNANTGAIIKFSGHDSHELAHTLSSKIVEIDGESLPGGLYAQLRDGGFLVPSGTDEVAKIRKRYLQARAETPIVLTLTSTMDCNLGCYYCYESRSKESLRLADVGAVVDLARSKLLKTSKKSLHVDWYGGEPLLNLSFIERASTELQRLCRENTIRYSASVISNGTQWPENAKQFIFQNCIRQVQISFDGLRDNHNRRRRYRSSDRGASSFDEAAALVDALLDSVRVDIRVNLDRWNQDDLLPFVDFARSRGWFGRRFPAVIQPARLASYSERSAFMRRIELSLEAYDTLRAAVRVQAGGLFKVEESEVPDGFPYPKTSVCAALAHDSEVIGPDGLKYRCGLQVGEKHRAVGELHPSHGERAASRFSDVDWWDAFDPTILPSCSRCSFLPICMGGCPKKHLEKDQLALAEQGKYWRRNLPRMIAHAANAHIPDDYTFSETDQFK